LDGKQVSSVIAQSYSRYIGIEVTIPSGSNIPSALFNYMISGVSIIRASNFGIMLILQETLTIEVY
jgi:hypothetical protein